MIKVTFCFPRSIRVKLNTRCQLRCKFCHQEGCTETSDVDPKELVEAIKILKRELGFYRIHFTGGEPTLYSEFEKLILATKKLDFINALTTNGQFRTEELSKLKKAGLDSINLSLHTLNPYVFLNIQDVPFSIKDGAEWARGCIERTIQNALTANKLLETKINCVISANAIGPREVLEFCIQNNIKLRFLNDLTLGDVATDKIREILFEKKAELIGHEITLLSSSHRLDYRIGNYQFGVKCIRPFFLKSLCDGCEFKGTTKCLEGFYGIRLENKPIRVRLCLNKSESPYVQSLSEFLKSPQFGEIKQEVANAIKYLRKDSIIEEQKIKYKLNDF
jgi:molybdenum cofactor biosynthesis enzyme MoaA